ncbi:transposable element Tcb2 transposase [Trichonephila clavipes]|nr:transposable element Tcb2 transposase [Trichonephila clavipes]
MDTTCQQRTVQAGGGSALVWGVCSECYMGPLIRLDTTLKSDSHFLWTTKSPDMNIIERIWDALQRAAQKRSPPSLTPTYLWTALQYSWCHLPPSILQTLIESISRLVAALLRARGRFT